MSAPHDKRVEKYEADNQLELFVSHVPTITAEAHGENVSAIFTEDPGLEGIVVLDGRQPAGIIMRTSFYQKFSSQYGHALYSKRSARLLMDPSFLTADIGDAISSLSMQAMAREQAKLYDYVVVCKDRAYFGVISIRYFLTELTKRNDAQIQVLKEQQIKLMTAHEQERLLRQDVESKSSSLKNLLDNADQGFLSFERDLAIKGEYSYKCVELFGSGIAGQSFVELIRPHFTGEKISVFEMVFDSYFSNASSVTDHVYLLLLPSDCVIGNTHVHLEYRRIANNGRKAVMVILSDVTEKIKLEKAIADDRNKQRLVLKALSYQPQIKQMLQDFRELMDGGYRELFPEGDAFAAGMSELLRAMHTFKGDFAQFGFITTSEAVHRLESELIDVSACGGTFGRIERIMEVADADKMLETDLNMIYDVIGRGYFDQSETLPVSKERLAEAKRRVLGGLVPMDKASVVHLLSSFERRNIKVSLNQYTDYLDYLSARLGKNRPVYIVEGDDIELNPETYSEYFRNLVHIFRNIMDHALESEEERIERGKPENGLIECRITDVDDSCFTIEITDDGRGVDLEKVALKAVQNGLTTAERLKTMSPGEIAGLIFAERLSTKESADSVSGRGVGMAAVRQSCAKLGGEVSLTTEEGRGTSFIFRLPKLY